MQNVLKRKNMYFIKKSCYQKHFIKTYVLEGGGGEKGGEKRGEMKGETTTLIVCARTTSPSS